MFSAYDTNDDDDDTNCWPVLFIGLKSIETRLKSWLLLLAKLMLVKIMIIHNNVVWAKSCNFLVWGDEDDDDDDDNDDDENDDDDVDYDHDVE